MKSKLLKTVVLASSLVFLNCGDDAVTSAMGDYSNTISSSSAGEVQPGTSSDSQGTAGTEISSSAAQQNNDAILPGSSASVEAGSSATVPGSSADVGPQAGSSSAAAPGAESSADVAASSSSDDKCLASSLPNACGDAPASSSATAPAVSSSSVSAPAVSSSSSEKKVESSSSEAAKPKGIFLADGKEEVYKTVTAGADGNWTYDFGEHPKYKKGGRTPITYTVREDAVENWMPEYSYTANASQLTANIRNTYKSIGR